MTRTVRGSPQADHGGIRAPVTRHLYRRRPTWLGIAGVLGILGLFELLVRGGMLDERYFPRISAVLPTLVERLATVDLWQSVWGTLLGWAVGLGVAILIGVPAGLLLGSSAILNRAFRVPVEFLRPIPSVALIPLAVLVYGSGLQSKVFLVAFASVWPLLVQSLYGMKSVDPILKDTARAFCLRRIDFVARVVIPAVTPYVGTGLRISAAIALILAITAEIVIGSDGLGSAIVAAQVAGATELMYALVILTGILGQIVNQTFMRLECHFLGWHFDQGRASE